MTIFPPTPLNTSFARCTPEMSNTILSVFQLNFHEIMNSVLNSRLCFTNGSKRNNRVDYANFIGDMVFSHRCRNYTLFYTTELQAISHCLKTTLNRTQASSQGRVIIFTDSFAVLSAMAISRCCHSLVKGI